MSDILLPGDAGFADVLAGKVFTSVNGYAVTGTMVNQTGNPAPVGTAKWGNGDLAVYPAQGYYKGGSGAGEIRVSVAQLQAAEGALVAGSIMQGVTVYGVAGNATNDATMDTAANQLLTGYTAYGQGVKRNGGMPNQGAPTFTPGPNAQGLAAGYYSGGTVSGVSVPAGNVLTGTTIAGTAGTMPNRGAPTWNPTTSNQGLAAGYYSGGTVNGSANLVAGNIKNGVNIFGVVGNVVQSGRTNGSAAGPASSTQSFDVPVSGLSFTPSFVLAKYNGGATASAGVAVGSVTDANSFVGVDATYPSGSSNHTITSGWIWYYSIQLLSPVLGSCTLRFTSFSNASNTPTGTFTSSGTMAWWLYGW